MARQTVSPKSTGGAGYNFEDEVIAWWALHLLVGQAPLDVSLGAPQRLRLQARPDGWLLDDLVADFASAGGPARAAISVKSEPLLKNRREFLAFVRDCWELHLTPGTTGFDSTRDRLVLATARLPDRQRTAVDDAIKRAASQSPESLDERIRQRGWCSQEVRAFIQDFACPEDLPGAHPLHSRRAGALLGAIRIQDFDFARVDSESRARAIRLCREQVDSGRKEDGQWLWEALISLVRQVRESGGELTLAVLLDRLRGQVRLKHHPDHAPAWQQLERLTTRWRKDTGDTIGGIRLSREKPLRALEEALRTGHALVLLGESGTGKSALLKALLDQELPGPAYCLHAEEAARTDGGGRPFDTWEDLVRAQPAPWALLALDGLDRLSRPNELQAVARILRELRMGGPGSPWRLILTCQPATWERLHEELRSRMAHLDPVTPLSLELLGEEELQRIGQELPLLAPLVARTELRPLTGNAKILDVLARAASGGGLPEGKAWRGEASLIEWYWNSYLRGADPRGPSLLEKLASAQADERRFLTPSSRLSGDDSEAVRELERLGVLSEAEGTVRITHDLHADYARQRYLLGLFRAGDHEEVCSRAGNPLWHRALRLLALHLLESPPLPQEQFLEAWVELFEAMERASPKASNGVDLLLEAIAFTTQPGRILDLLFSQMQSSRENEMLERFLLRFHYTTTVPHPRVMEVLRDAPVNVRAEHAATFRQPSSPSIHPVIEWIVRRRQDIHLLAQEALVTAIKPWLMMLHKRSHEPELPLRRELGEVILSIAEWKARVALFSLAEDRVDTYRVALRAGIDHPERVTHLIRSLARRPVEPAEGSANEDSNAWPDGPRGTPDMFFRPAALSWGGASALVAISPALAKEIFLALLIEYPRTSTSHAEGVIYLGPGHDGMQPLELALPSPEEFAPVKALLARAPAEGLDFVVRLIDFATERWCEHAGTSLLEESPQPHLQLTFDGKVQTYLGNESVFAWPRSASSTLLAAVLATLEKWLTEQQEQGLLDPALLRTLLQSARSAAFVGLITNLAISYPALLDGPLEPLVEVPELYQWTFSTDPSLLDAVAETFAQRDWQWPVIERLLERWRTVPESTLAPLLRVRLPAQLTPGNWKAVAGPDGPQRFEFYPPPELTLGEARVVAESTQMVLSLLGTPVLVTARFRGILHGEEPLTESELERLLAVEHAQGQTTLELREQRCGLAAVALCRFPHHLERSESWKQRCREWLLDACTLEPPLLGGYAPELPGNDTWDSFCADALPVLWREHPGDPELRRAMARLLGAGKSDAVPRLFKTLSESRDRHPEDFRRLLHLAVWISRLLFISRERRQTGGLAQAFQRRVSDYAARTLAPLPSEWPDIASAWPEEVPLPASGHEALPAKPGLHLTYLVHTWSWLYEAVGAPISPDRAFLVDCLIRLDRLILSTLPPTKEDRAGHSPPRWLYPYLGTWHPRLCAGYLVREPDPALRRRLWEPWLNLPAHHHSWPALLLESIYLEGLSEHEEPPCFRDALFELLDLAPTLPGTEALLREAPLIRSFLGCFEDLPPEKLWSPGREPLVLQLRDRWSRWTERALSTPESALAFLSLLKAPASKVLRVAALG